MPDLLAHALVGYALGRTLASRYDWMGPPHVTAVMAGTFIPDLVKAKLLVKSARVESLLGLPFDWVALATLGGSVVCVLVGVVLVESAERRRVGATLAVGAGSHLFLDGLLLRPTGRANPVLWPVTRYRPPSPGLYLSTQVEPTVLAALLALVVVLVTDPAGSRA